MAAYSRYSVVCMFLTAALTAALVSCTPEQRQQAESTVRSQSQKGLVIVYFWGEHCPSCKAQNDEFEKFRQQSKVPVYKTYPDSESIRKYNLHRTPTLIFLKNGVEVERKVGLTYVEDLVQITKQLESKAP